MTNAALSDDERDALRRQLLAERNRVAQQRDALMRTFDELVAAADLEPPDDEHDPDGTTAYERAQVTSLATSSRTRLDDLDRAITALDGDGDGDSDGTGGGYGTCEVCGRPIGRERLEAVLGTRRCVTCASVGP